MELCGILSGQFWELLTFYSPFAVIFFFKVASYVLSLQTLMSDCEAEYDPSLMCSRSCVGQDAVLKGHQA